MAKEEEKRHQEEKQQLSTTIALLNRRLEDGNMLVARIERSNKKRRARLQTNMDHVRQITSSKPSTLPGQGKGEGGEGGQSEDQHGLGRGSFTPSTDTDGIQRHEDSGSPTPSDPLLGSERLKKGAEVSPTTGLRHRTYVPC